MTTETPPTPPQLTTALPSFAMAWKALLLDQRVNDKAVRMYLLLSTYARPGRMSAFPGQARLSHELNCDERTVRRAGEMLVQTGWIKKVRRGRGRTNLYHLMIPNTVTIDAELPVDDPVEDVDEAVDDRTQMSLLDRAEMSGPYEEEPGEEDVTPQTPRKRGAGRARTRDTRAPLRADERSDDFAAWWDAYPRKTGKIDAEKAWRQMLPRLPDIETLIAATNATDVRTSREHPDAPDHRKYVPYPATWLRRGQWLDEAPAVDPIETPLSDPTRRAPCVLCGIPNPTQDRCMGVAQGRIGSIEECVWAE